MDTVSRPDAPQGDRQIRRVRWGDTVRIGFMAGLEDGTLVDSSIYSEPLIFTTGSQSIMEGIEMLVIGMSVGESKTEKITPDSAFGPYCPELSCEVSLSWLRAQGVVPLVGLGLEVRKTNGTLVHLLITGLDGDRVTLDANHRLAGKNLMVQLDLLDILGHAWSGLYSTPTQVAKRKRGSVWWSSAC